MSIDKVADHRVSLGRLAEQFSTEYIQRTLGWSIVHRNWRTRGGELDIVARDHATLVIIEVRSRQDVPFHHALESVSSAKMRQVTRVARVYLAQHHMSGTTPIRFDVMVVLFHHRTVMGFEHIRDAWQSA